MSKLDSEMIKNCPNKGECFCVRNFEEKRRNEFLQDKIQSLEQENEALKKKLSEAVEVIAFYSISANYGYNQDFDDDIEWISDEEHQPMGKKARAFLKENKYE